MAQQITTKIWTPHGSPWISEQGSHVGFNALNPTWLPLFKSRPTNFKKNENWQNRSCLYNPMSFLQNLEEFEVCLYNPCHLGSWADRRIFPKYPRPPGRNWTWLNRAFGIWSFGRLMCLCCESWLWCCLKHETSYLATARLKYEVLGVWCFCVVNLECGVV